MARSLQAAGAQPGARLLVCVSALAAVLGLGAAVPAYALPVEARTSEPWYAYQSSVGFDFLAHVQEGKFYRQPVLRPDQLLRARLPVEPPAYRRMLIGRFTDGLEIRIPYRFQADRPAPLRARLRVDGAIVLPGLWQNPYPLSPEKQLSVFGTELAGVATFAIPIGSLLAEMETTRRDLGLVMEPLEIHVQPVFEVEVAGLREPVQVRQDPDFLITLRAGAVEVEDPREVRTEKSFAETRVVPVTIPLFGREVRVAVLRQIATGALGACLVLGVILVALRRLRPADPRTTLQKLGPGLIVARAFELPADAAVAEVWTPRELVRLHVQTERPVIQVGSTYYLLDGTTCYRLSLSPPGAREG